MMTRGARVLLVAFGLSISFVAGTETEPVDAGSQQDEDGSGSEAVEVEAGSGSQEVEAGSGSQEVEAGSGSQEVEAGSGSEEVEAGSGSQEVGDHEAESESGPTDQKEDQKEDEAERTPSRQDIAKVALTSAKRIEKKYKAMVTKAYDAVEEANKHLLMQVKNGTRSEAIFKELQGAVKKALVERRDTFEAELNASLEKAASWVKEDEADLAEDKAQLKKEEADKYNRGHVGKKELKALSKRVKEDKKYLEGALQEEKDEEHKTLPAMTKYEMFDKLLAARKAKASATVEARVSAVKDACDQLSKAADNVVTSAQAAGEDQSTSEHQSFMTMSWCEDLLFKAQNLEHTSLGLVAELYAEAAIDEQRLKLENDIKEEEAKEKAAGKAAERQKVQKRKDAIAEAKADMEATKRVEKDAAEVASALKEVQERTNDLDAYTDSLSKRDGSRIAQRIVKDATEDMEAKKVSLKKKLNRVLKELAQTGSADGLDLGKWEALLKSANSLRSELSDMDSDAHKRRAVFARLNSHVKMYQDHVTGLQFNATEARRAFGQIARKHVADLKSIGASRSMYEGDQDKANDRDSDLRDMIQNKAEAANEAVSKLRSAIREALEEDLQPQPEPEEAVATPEPEQAPAPTDEEAPTDESAPTDEAAPTHERAPEVLTAVTSKTDMALPAGLVLVAGMLAMVSAAGWTSRSRTPRQVPLLG